MTGARHLKATQLARWLGPWASGEGAPSRVVRQSERLDPAGISERPVRAYRYEPRDGKATGAYVISPGLHYAGPDDPRMDRFCRILASAGLVVLAVFVDDYLQLSMTERARQDVAVGCEHAARMCAERGLPRPALFSISFGSAPAISVAADERHRDRIGGLFLFGGFHDFNAVIRFAITKRAFDGISPVAVPHDPLNNPAVFINLLPLLGHPSCERLQQAWLEMARRTWGRPSLRPPARRNPIADAIAAELPQAERELFRIGCGLAPGGGAWLEAGLSRAGDRFAFTDPSRQLRSITAPVVIAHGRDDDVIPYPEADKLRSALRGNHPHQMHLTGMFGHTGTHVLDPGAAAAELDTMRKLLLAMVDAPHERLASA